MGSLWVLAFAASIALCGSQLQHYTKSPDEHNCDNRVCEYVYSFEMIQFKENDQPLTMSTTVQIMCESTGTYGSLSATRYCMSVSDVGGSILTFRGNQTTEADNRETLMREYALERLSGWFCLVQTTFGQVVSVFHSTTEEVEVVNIKKGIASAFQANLRGTTEEIEIDPQSKHISHYSYPDSVDEVRKMRRTIDSEDIIEFPMHIPTRDVKLHEEEDIEYKDGRLIKSNGTLHLSIDSSSTSRLEGSDEFSNVFTAHGSFSMELKLCRISARFSRKRRAIQNSVDGSYSVEENLMATFDERKMELEKLETLRRDLKTPQQVLTALQNINSGKNFKALGQVMVLERKYGAMGVSVTDTVIYYLRKIQPEEDMTQRVAIYSLLSSEGSTKAENALMERLLGEAVSELEKQSIILALSSLPTPSPHVIQTLEEMISQSGNESSTLLLAYGAIVANAPSTQKERMVSFLTALLPPVTSESTHGVIHVLHALGNTKSSLAVEHIVQYLLYEDEDVRVTAVTALRFFTARPDTQQHLLDMLYDSSDIMVEAIVHALRDGYEYNREMPLDQELIESLANVTINLGNFYLQDELMYFLRAVGTHSSLALVDLIVSSRAEEARLKRDTSIWDDPSSEYNFICPLSERQADVRSFPSYQSYLWSKTVGKDEGDHKVYLKSGVGLFAGGNECHCDFKTLGKAVVRGHLLGWEADAVKILGYLSKHNGTIKGKAYVKFVGSVLLDVDLPPSVTYQLPQYDLTLFSVSFTFTVYIVPVTLSASLPVHIGGHVFAGLEVGESGSIKGTVSFTPFVTATLDASASASILVAKVGIFITGTITYNISARASVAVCRPQNPWFVEICVGADHGWSPISITLGAFYQLRTWRLSWGSRRTWSPLTHTWTLPGSGRLPLFEVCTDTDGGESTPPTTTCPSVTPVSTSSTTPTASWPKYRPTPTPTPEIVIPHGSGAEPAPPTKPPLTKPKPFFPPV